MNREDCIQWKLGYIEATLASAVTDAERRSVSWYTNTFREAHQMAEELLRMDIPDPRKEEVYRALTSREERASVQDEHLEEDLSHQYTPEPCPGRPCGSECDHRGSPPRS